MGVATLRRARAFYQTFPNGSAISADPSRSQIRSTALIESGTEGGKIRSTPLIESGSDVGSQPTVKKIRSTALIESGSAVSTKVRRKKKTKKIRSTALIESSKRVKALFPPILGWSHYLVLLRVQDSLARSFYEIEAARESWSVRELERQIAAMLFERLCANRNPEQVRALAQRGQEVVVPSDVLKDPFFLEFVDLRDMPTLHEHDLEHALIARLQDFLLEMGKGFCFVARQKRITLDGDHFYVDLVLYNRLLRCFVLLDLKMGKLTHQDLGQMQMYVNFFDRLQREPHEEKTIGIVLCSDKNDAMVKITLPADNEQVVAARYQTYLPTEDELRAELTREREEAERALRLATDIDPAET
ncbi:MAG: DUF1016 family protein [Polyangiaceae bacterium]|nr:DUF1016 family protein [Polyangiaceae bacterium]